MSGQDDGNLHVNQQRAHIVSYIGRYATFVTIVANTKQTNSVALRCFIVLSTQPVTLQPAAAAYHCGVQAIYRKSNAAIIGVHIIGQLEYYIRVK